MAWITKNSATMQIDRREEPYLDDAFKADMQKNILTRYPQKRAALLPILHAVQHKHGYITEQAMEEIGAFLEVAPADVFDTATFYEEYWFKPKGKYVIWICQSLSCELNDQIKLREKIQEKLSIVPGETTENGKFTLMNVECLGSCGTSPCALINEKLHENLTADNLVEIIDALE